MLHIAELQGDDYQIPLFNLNLFIYLQYIRLLPCIQF